MKIKRNTYFPSVINMMTDAIAMIRNVSQPIIFARRPFVFSLRISLSLAIFIITKIIGTDTTPLITEAYTSALIGLYTEKIYTPNR